MSIDDITIMLRLPEGTRVRLRPMFDGRPVLEGTQRSGRSGVSLDFRIVRRTGMILKYIEETRDLYLKLSVPRLLGRQPYNFPLRPLREFRSLNLIPAATLIIDALGLPQPRIRQGYSAADPREALPTPLERWSVVRVAYALDVDVGDGGVIETIRAFSTLPRENAGNGTTWKWRNTVTGVQWGSVGSNRLMVYSKAAEILRRCPKIRREQGDYGPLDDDAVRERETRRALAESAVNIIRFEATLDGGANVRSLFGMPSPMAPTFQLMARQDLERYVLGRELARLRLHQLHELEEDEEADVPDVVNLLHQVCRAGRRYNEGGQRARRRSRVSLARVYMLAMFYVTEGRVSRQQVVDWFGGGESTLKTLAADLRLLGLPSLSTTSMEPHRRLRAFMEAVRRQVPTFPQALPELDVDTAYAQGLATDAPWIEEVLLTDMEGMSIDRDDDPVLAEV